MIRNKTVYFEGEKGQGSTVEEFRSDQNAAEEKTVSFSNLILNSEGILFFTETLIKKVLLEVKSMKKAIRLKETYR